MKRPGTASLLAASWAGLLALLGLAWVNSPAVGPLPVLLVWTVLALALAVLGGRWLAGRTSLLPGRTWGAGLVLVWAAVLWTVWKDLGRTLVLDGLILREPHRVQLGRALTWAPFALALLYVLAMLALALEVRYRLAHPEKYRESLTPPQEGAT